MNTAVKLVISVMVLGVLAGCNAFSVHEGATSVNGVPFYIKKERLTQVTVRHRYWIDIRLDVKSPDRAATIQTFRLYASPQGFSELAAYNAHSAAAGADPDQIANTFATALDRACSCVIDWSTIDEETSVQNAVSSLGMVLVSNKLDRQSYVDYGAVHYFNSRVPPFGTNTATVELAPDGTMTKGTAAPDATKLADLIPLKELLIDKWGLGADAVSTQSSNMVSNGSLPVEMTVAIDGFVYRYSRELDRVPAALTPLDAASALSIERSRFGAPDSAKPKEDGAGAITFEGAVKLPKP